MDQRTEQHRLAQQMLEEKRTDLLKTETQLREIEDKYYSSTSMVNDKLTQDLRVISRVSKEHRVLNLSYEKISIKFKFKFYRQPNFVKLS